MFGIINQNALVKEKRSDFLKKCCFTGYRPQKFPFSLNKENIEYRTFEDDLIIQILELVNQGCSVFYSGMAMGFDIIAAEAVLFIKKTHKTPIKLICVIPFQEQSKSFDDYWKEKYSNILEVCDEKIVLSEEYHKNCYRERNEYMVKNSDYVITWFDGRPGGTKNTLDYAARQGRYIFNINKKSENYAVQTFFDII